MQFIGSQVVDLLESIHEKGFLLDQPTTEAFALGVQTGDAIYLADLSGIVQRNVNRADHAHGDHESEGEQRPHACFSKDIAEVGKWLNALIQGPADSGDLSSATGNSTAGTDSRQQHSRPLIRSDFPELQVFTEYGRMLRPFEQLDYTYLRHLLESLYIRAGFD